MINFRRVLIPVDVSQHSRRLLSDCSILFQEANGQEFHLVHVWQPPALGYDESTVAGLESELEEFKKGFTPTGDFQVKTVLLEGHPATEICNYAKKLDCDLITLATHGRTGLQHMVIGSVAENVVRSAPCPVMTMRIAS
jgi:nucleotide-binding universal stress UspA family protein